MAHHVITIELDWDSQDVTPISDLVGTLRKITPYIVDNPQIVWTTDTPWYVLANQYPPLEIP